MISMPMAAISARGHMITAEIIVGRVIITIVTRDIMVMRITAIITQMIILMRMRT